MAEGLDFSYGSGLTANAMKAGGKHFVCRYLSTQPNSKNISSAEARNYLNAGISIVLVWETTADRILSGNGGGTADAREADRQARALGFGGIPLYFACDIDATPGQQGAINAYLDGCASVIGRGRVGMYAGYWPLKRAFDAGKMHYGWQTYAWSGGNWDRRAQLQQYHNAAHFGPAEVDLNRSMATDFGQWPRPHAAASAPPAKPAPAKLPAGTMEFDGRTPLGTVAKSRNYQTTAAWLEHQQRLHAGDHETMISRAVPPKGTRWHVNP